MQGKDCTVIRFLFIELRPWPVQLYLGKHFTKSQCFWLEIWLKSNSLYLIFWQFSYNKILQKPWQCCMCIMSLWFPEIWVISHQRLQCRNFECLKSSVKFSFGGLCYLLSDGVPSGNTWWCHQIETLRVTGPLCRDSWVTGELPSKRPVVRSIDVLFDLHLNKLLSEQLWCWWFGTSSCSLWHHCNEFVAWWQQAITWTNVDLSSVRSLGIHLGPLFITMTS